jgi:Tfp pilus assembly protein PilO
VTGLRTRFRITPRALLVALGVVGVVVAWAIAFYVPQGHKLAALDAQKTSLQSTVTADEARLQQVQREDQHIAQIRLMHDELVGYVPPKESLYTYIRTISHAAKASGVTITSLSPSALVAVTGTSYSAVPISASVRGTYDHLLSFIKHLYDLSRLTDVNSLSISGGGPSTGRSTVLSASFQLAIFTSQALPGVP